MSVEKESGYKIVARYGSNRLIVCIRNNGLCLVNDKNETVAEHKGLPLHLLGSDKPVMIQAGSDLYQGRWEVFTHAFIVSLLVQALFKNVQSTVAEW